MVFHKHIPSLPLSSYVDCMVYVEGNNKGIGLPKAAMSLVFNLHDGFRLYSDRGFTAYTEYKKYWVAGLQTQPSFVESYGLSKMLVVQFTATGAAALLQVPLYHFQDQYVPLDSLINHTAELVWEQIQEAPSIAAKFAAAEAFLRDQLSDEVHLRQSLLHAVGRSLEQPGATQISDICREHRISRKHLNFLCKEYLGLSPKMLSSLNRLHSVLYTLASAKPEKLTSLAYQMDYFDQAHFNNHFKRFTGMKPNEYVRSVEATPSLKLMPHFIPVS